jgi:hypothetical protein
MVKKTLCAIAAAFALSRAIAQSSDPVVLSYQRNFIRSSLSTKIELLNDASRITTVNMTPLYADAIDFTMENYPYFGNDQQLLDVAAVAIQKSVPYGDATILPSVKAAFTLFSDQKTRLACLSAFSVLAAKKQDEITFLNDWFAKNIASSGADAKTLSACAETLGKLASSSSFGALFAAATGEYDSGIVAAAKAALGTLNEGFTDNILAILAEKNDKRMYAAFSLASRKENLPSSDRGLIAERAFTLATTMIESSSAARTDALSLLIKESMEQLVSLSWSRASPSVVKYFYFVQKEQSSDGPEIDMIIPVVNCMGAMGTTEAAQALSIYLGLLNSETEQKKTYNEQLMLSVINALGTLGDKTAFDYLLYVGYLNYPETVKKASRDALARLQW